MADNPKRERDLGLPRIEVGGRFFTKYDPNIALDIVERIADGELLSKITAKDASPITITRQTFLRWVATVPELSTAYSAALQISAQAFEEKAIDKAERTAEFPGSPQNVSAASLLVSQYRWSAARRNPTRYSDKGNTQIVVPVNINTTLDMGSMKQTIDVEVPDIYTISAPIQEGEFSEIESPEQAVSQSEPERAEETIPKKEELRALVVRDQPVIGVSHQPIYVRALKGNAAKGVKGPRKRVLHPRTPKEK